MSEGDERLPRELRRLLESIEYEVEAVVSENPRKSRYNLRLTDDAGEPFFAKWSSESDKFHKSLMNEKRAYDRGWVSHAPALLTCEGGLLIFKYENTIQLREYLHRVCCSTRESDLPSFSTVLSELVTVLRETYFDDGRETRSIDRSTVADSLVGNYQKLLTSGPQDSERSSIEYYLAASAGSATESRAWTRIYEWLEQVELHTQRIHGDLHLDNVLVDKETGSILLVDWETARWGNELEDLTYCFAIIQQLLRAAPSKHRALRDAFRELIGNKPCSYYTAFEEVSGLLSAAAGTNRRFNKQLDVWTSLTNALRLVMILSGRQPTRTAILER
jgi:hypothetical protein